MKAKVIVAVFGLAIAMMSCDVDVEPTVIFTVVDSTNKPLSNARLITSPCLDGVPCDTARINQEFVKYGFTNEAGQLTYKYPYSAIINVNAAWAADTTNGVWDFYIGQTVARFETKRQKSDEKNEYQVKVVVLKDIKP